MHVRVRESYKILAFGHVRLGCGWILMDLDYCVDEKADAPVVFGTFYVKKLTLPSFLLLKKTKGVSVFSLSNLSVLL